MAWPRPGVILFAAFMFPGCGDDLEGTGEVRGDLLLGGETRMFRPCDVDERWWVDTAPFENDRNPQGWDTVTGATVERCRGSGGCGVTGVYIEGVATVSGRGRHGHLGKYDRNVVFVSAARALSETPASCTLAALDH